MFLNTTHTHTHTKEKTDKLNHIKIKNIYLWKDTISER